MTTAAAHALAQTAAEPSAETDHLDLLERRVARRDAAEVLDTSQPQR